VCFKEIIVISCKVLVSKHQWVGALQGWGRGFGLNGWNTREKFNIIPNKNII
jgi:hypothetical protein